MFSPVLFAAQSSNCVLKITEELKKKTKETSLKFYSV